MYTLIVIMTHGYLKHTGTFISIHALRKQITQVNSAWVSTVIYNPEGVLVEIQDNPTYQYFR